MSLLVEEDRDSNVIRKEIMVVSWLMRHMQFVVPRLSGRVTNNTIRMHLVMQLEKTYSILVFPRMSTARTQNQHTFPYRK